MKVSKIDCPSCGAKISPTSKYCEYCGSAIHIDYGNQKTDSKKSTTEQNQKQSRFEIKSQIILLVVFMSIWIIASISIGIEVIMSQPSFDFTQIIPFLMAAAGGVFLWVGISNLLKNNKDENNDDKNNDDKDNKLD